MIFSLRQYISNLWFSFGLIYRAAPRATIFILITTILVGVLPVISTRLIAEIVDKFTLIIKSGEPLTKGLPYIVLWVSVDVLRALVNTADNFVNTSFHHRIKTYLEFYVLNKIAKIDLGREEDPDYQDLTQRAMTIRGYWPATELGTSFINQMLYKLSSVVIALVFIIQYNPWFALIIFAFSIPGFFVDVKFDANKWHIWWGDRGRENREYNMHRRLIFNKTARVELQMWASLTSTIVKLKAYYNKFDGKTHTVTQKKLIAGFFAEILSLGAYAFCLVYVVKSVFSGQLEIGMMLFIATTLGSLNKDIQSLLVGFSSAFDTSRHVTELRAYFAVEPLVKTPNPVFLKLKSSPIIEIQNLTFAYPRTPAPIIKKMNVTFRGGEKIGIVGNNGSGKSTFIKLLLRVYDPQEGRILIDGIPLKNIAPENWHANISALLQEYHNYDLKVSDAIALSNINTEKNPEKVLEAATKSTADDFIQKYPDKYEQQLGVEFGGKEPSKGQKQKLALARAFYRDSYILFLDEPTAAIDADSELSIFRSLDNLPEDKTVFFISHDFSTIRRADRILVFEDGQIIEDGSHEELLAKAGMYSSLYNKQKEAYE